MTTVDSTGKLYVVSAPSGAGKTSLIAAIVDEMPNLIVSVSYTTRPKREGEEGGVHYNYVDQAEFDRLIAEDVFLEHANVFGKHYGTSKVWVDERLKEGFDILLEIDWQGAANVRKYFADNAVSIFILPPSLETLDKRLRGRKQDSEEVIAKRMTLATQEISHCDEYDYVIVNDDFDRAFGEMKAVITAERQGCKAQLAKTQEILRNLLAI
jgi:guanylate kinase